tara:strand:- start:16 stop:228 length:213 start_codon:yes stop_codon:yes gene_type:complete
MMSGVMSDPRDYQEPESDGSLEFWMWCEEQMELEEQSNTCPTVLDGSDICPKCGKQGGEYTPTLDACAFC